MNSGSSSVRYFLTGLAVLVTTGLVGLVTRSLLVVVVVALIWAGVLGRQVSKSSLGTDTDRERAEQAAVRY